MKKNEARELFLALNKLGDKKGAKFAYGVSRNIGLLKPEMEALDKAIEITPEFKKCDDERVEIVKKYAKKDDKGEFVMKNPNDYEMADMESFNKEFEIFKKENKDVSDARTKQIEEYIELLKTPSTVSLHKIALNDIPQDISVSEMFSIKEIVDEALPSPYNTK